MVITKIRRGDIASSLEKSARDMRRLRTSMYDSKVKSVEKIPTFLDLLFKQTAVIWRFGTVRHVLISDSSCVIGLPGIQ
jgi:hypothetical protein